MASTKNSTNTWQISMRSLNDSGTFLFDNPTMSDVTFVFNSDATKDSPASETKIYAHSWLLSMLSPVFYEKFKDSFEISKQIPVSDTSYDCFLECIRFVYTNVCVLSDANVVNVMKIAQNYSLKFLEEECANYIVGNLPTKCLCPMLDQAIIEGYNALKEKVIDIIAPKIHLILLSNTFLTIKKESLEAILNIEKMGPVTEVEIFEGVMKWARKKCISTEMEANGSNKRLQLGELIKKIRFPTMSCDELGICIAKEEGLLTFDESLALFLSVAKAKDNELGFRADERNYCLDFNNTNENYILINEGLIDPYKRCSDHLNKRTKFSVNKMIYLTGIRIAQTNEIPEGIISVTNDKNEVLCEDTFVATRGSNNYVNTKLKEPILIEPKRVYTIDILLKNEFCRFRGARQVVLPWSTCQAKVEFNFLELSQLLTLILFNHQLN